MKRTPLFEAHKKLGARLIEFGGWEMPVFYTSIAEEHLATRKAAGLFDISHMGEIWVEGAGAGDFLNFALTNDIRKLRPGLGQYTLLCNERGGVVDDLYVYQVGAAEFLMVVNASRKDEDFAWLKSRRAKFDLTLEDRSDQFGAVALQGPRAAAIAGAIIVDGANPTTLRKNEVLRAGKWLVSRTGYTGEDGFEIVAPSEAIGEVWARLLEAGRPHGLKPAGLGARDTLRTEVCYPLYGHELDEKTSPLEAGLGFFIALDKGDFIGKPVLLAEKAAGPRRRLAAFKMAGRCAPPRQGYPIWTAGSAKPVGVVTSGTQSPSLGMGIGMGYVEPIFSAPNTTIEIEIRGQRAPAVVVAKPIYKPERLEKP